MVLGFLGKGFKSISDGLQNVSIPASELGGDMTREEKLEIILAFEAGYTRIEELITGIEPNELRFSPPVRDAWSINDFLVHFLDADISLAFRVRRAIAEPGMSVPVWEEGAWHDALHYNDEDGLVCLSLAKGIRAFVAAGLRSVVDADWSEFSILHPSKGRMELEALIEAYEQHIIFHLPLIKRNRQAWQKRGQ
jgi:hypothetical protein